MPLKMHQDEMPTINLTPMIDIIFQLIIFFMVGSRFTEMDKKVDVKVPTTNQAASLPTAPTRFVVNVQRDGQLIKLKVDARTAAVLGSKTRSSGERARRDPAR